MEDGYDVLHKLFVRREGFVLDDEDLRAVFQAEALKPIEAEADEAVFMRDDDGLDLLRHHIFQEPVPFLPIVVQSTPKVLDAFVNDDSLGILGPIAAAS